MKKKYVNRLNNEESDSVLNLMEYPVKKNLEQRDFLRLMVTQIQSQDFMQAQINCEFISHLSKLCTKDGITKMQESLQQMENSLQSNQALQASALVGRKVLVYSNKLKLGAEGEVKTAIDILKDFSYVSASIYKQSGELIKIISLGKPNPGFFQFNWDGTDQNNKRMFEGTYRIEVCGIFEGQEVFLQTMTSANIDSVNFDQHGKGLKLNLEGVGSVSLDQVKQIIQNSTVES